MSLKIHGFGDFLTKEAPYDPWMFITENDLLVAGLELLVWNMNFIFHNIWDVILPIDFHIFQDRYFTC